MNLLRKIWAWIYPTQEESKVSEPITDVNAVSDAPVAAVATDESATVVSQPVLAEVAVKAGVKDFEAALAFVEAGVAQLGVAAKDELKALATKYL